MAKTLTIEKTPSFYGGFDRTHYTTSVPESAADRQYGWELDKPNSYLFGLKFVKLELRDGDTILKNHVWTDEGWKDITAEGAN